MTTARSILTLRTGVSRLLVMLMAGAVIVVGAASPVTAQMFARRYAGHEAWAAYHIANLAPEIRAGVLRHEKACGTPLAATHAFTVSSLPDARTVTLHYESLWCATRAGGLCKGANCLHEVYVRDRERYRLSFRGYVRDVQVDARGRIVVMDEGG